MKTPSLSQNTGINWAQYPISECGQQVAKEDLRRAARRAETWNSDIV